MANNFNLGVDEDGIEELLEAVTEELTNKELPEWEQECIAEAKAREQKLQKNKKNPQENTVKGLAESFSDHNKLL